MGLTEPIIHNPHYFWAYFSYLNIYWANFHRTFPERETVLTWIFGQFKMNCRTSTFHYVFLVLQKLFYIRKFHTKGRFSAQNNIFPNRKYAELQVTTCTIYFTYFEAYFTQLYTAFYFHRCAHIWFTLPIYLGPLHLLKMLKLHV